MRVYLGRVAGKPQVRQIGRFHVTLDTAKLLRAMDKQVAAKPKRRKRQN